MVTKGKAERKFTSPAGVLTLLRAGGWSERLDLLGLIELSRYEGLHLLLDVWEEPCGATRDPARRRPMGGWSELDAMHALVVTDALARWLRKRPAGPLSLGAASVETIVAMACCWSTAITHALADQPQTFEELAAGVDSIYSEEVLEEHLELLVKTGQAERYQELGQLNRYRLTSWGVEALTPLIAAVRREAYLPDENVMAPEILDVEAAFKLAASMLQFPDDLIGSCHLGVHIESEKSAKDQPPIIAGARVDVAGGEVLSTSILLEEKPQNWVRGSAQRWCDAVVDPAAAEGLSTGGDPELSGAILTGLHECLFGDAS